MRPTNLIAKWHGQIAQFSWPKQRQKGRACAALILMPVGYEAVKASGEFFVIQVDNVGKVFFSRLLCPLKVPKVERSYIGRACRMDTEMHQVLIYDCSPFIYKSMFACLSALLYVCYEYVSAHIFNAYDELQIFWKTLSHVHFVGVFFLYGKFGISLILVIGIHTQSNNRIMCKYIYTYMCVLFFRKFMKILFIRLIST